MVHDMQIYGGQTSQVGGNQTPTSTITLTPTAQEIHNITEKGGRGENC